MDGTMGYAKPVKRFHAALAYLVHLNNPEKEQFKGGISEIVTNRQDLLDGVVKREPEFNCLEWDEEHQPLSFMDSLGVISKEGFLTASETVKLVSWYANHLDLFEERREASEGSERGSLGVFQEVE